MKLSFTIHNPYAHESILCLHGNRDSSQVFDMLGENMGRYCMICPDLRGHGETYYTGRAFTLEEMLGDLVELVKDSLPNHFAVIGHSLGASLALLLAKSMPNRITRLVLMGVAPTFRPPFVRPEPGTEITSEVVQQVNSSAQQYFFTKKHPEVKEQILQGWQELPRETHRLMMSVGHPDLTGIAKSIRLPTLLLCGQKDRITPVKQCLKMNTLLPNSRCVILPETGHFMFLEEPDKTAALIQSFLEERI